MRKFANAGSVTPHTFSTLKSQFRDRATVYAALITLVYAILALAYSVINPLFEAPDEWLHYQFVRHLVEQHTLPVQTATALTEYQQPPLYYAAGALLIGGIRSGPFDLQVNPFWGYDQYRFGVDNKVQFVHTARERFPYLGTALAAHLLRWYSITLGILTLVAGWHLLQQVFGRSALALSALVIMAWNPQYVFMTASINNDNLAALLGTLSIGWSLLVLQRGITVRRVIIGGLLLSAALLTKVSVGALAIVMLAALFFAPGTRAARLKALASITAMVAILCGWWFIRNVQLYGELTGVNTMLRAWGVRPIDAGLSNLSAQLSYTWTSYWGRFGIGQIVLPDWAYGLITMMGLLGLIGFVRQIIRPTVVVDRRSLALLILAVVAACASLIWFALVNPSGANGRYLFPAAAAFSALLVYGWRGLYRAKTEKFDEAFALSVGAVFLTFSIGALWAVVAPAYAVPAQIDLTQVRQTTRADNIQFDQVAILLGHVSDRRLAQAGDEVNLKLCWQTLQPTAWPVAFYIHLLGADNAIVGERTSFHGLSRYPSVNWEPDRIFCDDVPVVVKPSTLAGLYEVEVGLIDPVTRVRVPAADAAGSSIDLIILDRIKVRSSQPPIVPAALPQPIDFGGQIKLLATTVEPNAVSAGQSMTATLYWQAARVPDKDHTVFVHLLDAQGQQVANADSMPQANRYPTSFWDVDEIVPDAHRIDLPSDLPPGQYQIVIGWYDLATGARLPINGDPNGAWTIGAVEVAP